MSKKNSRSGGKFSGNHTTLIPAAEIIADIAAQCEFTYNISPGFIKGGVNSANGQRRVKIINLGNRSILLSVRDNASVQEIQVYTHNTPATILTIAKGARNAGLHISFENRL